MTTKLKDILNLDIPGLVRELITPIDKLRSQSVGEGYMESRLNTFYRMMGFPVAVSGDENFYSPGFDLDLNTDLERKLNNDSVKNELIEDKTFCSQQLDPREKIFKEYSTIFSSGGFNSTALALGSIYIRSFEQQFGNTGPFELDGSQIQTVGQRNSELLTFYNAISDIDFIKGNISSNSSSFESLTNTGLLFSNHLLKPFIVDPRIDPGAIDNQVSAPFPKDASAIRKFDKGIYPRPYIEYVITTRFSAENNGAKTVSIAGLINDIKNDETVTDAFLLELANNPQKLMVGSEIQIFGTYLTLMRSLINRLITCIKDIQKVSKRINYQPVPDPKLGLEGNISINAVDPDDAHNQNIEEKILQLYRTIALQQASAQTQQAQQVQTGFADTGGYVFSGLEDSVFAAGKSTLADQQKELDRFTKTRNTAASQASEELRNIEYIMGEFSGLGLIDIVAIQAAFWIMDPAKLLGLIDDAAFSRIIKYRPGLSVENAGRVEDIEACLMEYESNLKQVYLILQLHYDQVMSGKAFDPNK